MWAATAAELQMAGVEAVAVDYGSLGSDPTYQAVAARIAAGLDGTGWTLVVHSGAGSLAPSVVEVLSAPAAVIFVDAILPHPGRAWLGTVPAALGQRLVGMATDGMLPPWNTWFGADPLPSILTNGSLRANFTAELPLVPVTWLQTPAPSLDSWTRLPCSFLQLSAAYAAEAVRARANGWAVRRLDLHHLAMITDPDKVAGALLSLDAA